MRVLYSYEVPKNKTAKRRYPLEQNGWMIGWLDGWREGEQIHNHIHINNYMQVMS